MSSAIRSTLWLCGLAAVVACQQGASDQVARPQPQPASAPEEPKIAKTSPSSEPSARPASAEPPPQPVEPVVDEQSKTHAAGVQRRSLPAVESCDGGFDIPSIDYASVPWWNELTAKAREAVLTSETGRAWDERSRAPIVVYQTAQGVELRSIDGCWEQPVTAKPGLTWVIDGPSATAWGRQGKEVLLLDLLGTADPLLLAEDSTPGFPVFTKGEEGPSFAPARSWYFGPPDPRTRRRTLEVRWTSDPRLLLRRGDDLEEVPLSPEAKTWLSANEGRFSPTLPRPRLIDLSPSSSIAQEPSRCRDAELCLAAGPLGATNKELVRYGEIDVTQRDDTAMGPLCAIFDPQGGTWYSDIRLQQKGTTPREFSEDDTDCGIGIQADVTGRAFLWNDQLCVNGQCQPVIGAIGFVRGNVFLTAGGG